MKKENARQGVAEGKARGGALVEMAAPDGCSAGLREEADRLIAQMADVRGYYELLLADARERLEPPNEKDALGLIVGMGTMSRKLGAVIEGLDGERRTKAGIARGEYALDLAAARAEVLSRLDKLAEQRRTKRAAG